MQKAKQIWLGGLVLAGCLALALAAVLASPVQADKPLQETEKYCLSCHGNPDLKMTLPSGEEVSLYISTDDLKNSVHSPVGIECEACHTGGIPTQSSPLVATPSAALVCDGSGVGAVTLDWQYTDNVQLRVRSASNPQGSDFGIGGPTGSVATGKWVSDGTWFDLFDLRTGKLVQSVPVNATVLGCVSNAPGSATASR